MSPQRTLTVAPIRDVIFVGDRLGANKSLVEDAVDRAAPRFRLFRHVDVTNSGYKVVVGPGGFSAMGSYNVFVCDREDRVFRRDVIYAETDQQAVEIAAQINHKFSLELWEVGRQVAVLPVEHPLRVSGRLLRLRPKSRWPSG